MKPIYQTVVPGAGGYNLGGQRANGSLEPETSLKK